MSRFCEGNNDCNSYAQKFTIVTCMSIKSTDIAREKCSGEQCSCCGTTHAPCLIVDVSYTPHEAHHMIFPRDGEDAPVEAVIKSIKLVIFPYRIQALAYQSSENKKREIRHAKQAALDMERVPRLVTGLDIALALPKN